MRVVAVDVGSVRTGSFAWAAVDVPDDGPVPEALAGCGSDPATAARAVTGALTGGGSAVLALEAPMAVPVPGDWTLLGKGRAGEGNRPWSASAGAGALGTGLVQGAWMLSELGRAVPGVAVTTQLSRWAGGAAAPRRGAGRYPTCGFRRAGATGHNEPADARRRIAALQRSAPLLLVEAFVSGAGKPVPTVLGQHAADAEAAARAVAERLAGGGETDVLCAPHRAFNLLAAGAMWAGLEIAGDELGMDVLVVRARPVGRA
ncbi:hypothetical protein ACIBU0_17180 [Streptomyces sp. NPDC049627]|uniref:hypothetical protein n=1 Tax=Streptomyces sp. NPDC049627 TaxID=3365595 RepID=UPI0037B2B4F9